MYLPSLNSIFSATSDYNLKKLCWHTAVLKPFVICFRSILYSIEQRKYHHRRIYSIIWKPRNGQKSIPRKSAVVKVGPDRHTISNLVKKFGKTGSVLDDYSQCGRPSTAWIGTNIRKVRGLTHRNIKGLRCWFEWYFTEIFMPHRSDKIKH
jgi:hypothetical protein